MNAILKYLVNMLPYMLIALPIYLVARIIFLKSKKRKLNWFREAAMLVFVLFAVGLASQTIIPKFEFGVNGFGIVQERVHKTNLIPFKVLYETVMLVRNGNFNYFLINFLGNIILFAPFGFFIPLLWGTSAKKTVLIGFCCSLFIEICQLFLARGTDVDDLILNTSGVLLGVLIFKLFRKIFKDFAEKFAVSKGAL